MSIRKEEDKVGREEEDVGLLGRKTTVKEQQTS
jgi:hypothetical protein